MGKRVIIFLVIVLTFKLQAELKGQNVRVRIAPTVQKYINDVSTLDRNKFFGLHDTRQDDRMKEFAAKYDLKLGGRGFWGPHSFSSINQKLPVGEYPSQYNGPDHPDFKVPTFENGDDAWLISVQHPRDVVKIGMNLDAAADYAAEWFLNTNYSKTAIRPKYFEPMNEPFVKANDEEFWDQPGYTERRMIETMTAVFKTIGKRFKEIPELDNMKVIGFSDAWVSYEVNDFGLWDSRMKYFMDEAGEYMDAFAIHIYDGINVVGEDSRRSGSNSEAVLDMVESYSMVKWDFIKPHALTEFGGIELGYGPNYTPVRASQALRSFNHLIFNFMDRTKDMEMAVPFVGGFLGWTLEGNQNKAKFVNAIYVPEPLGVAKEDTENYEWVLGPQAYFYILWQNVKGDRVFIDSDNPDIQVQAFSQGNQLVVALNNLDDFNQTIDLDMIDNDRNLTNLTVRRMKVYDDRVFEYDEADFTESMGTVSLIPSETVILEYTYDENITFDNNLKSTKYYSKNFLTRIEPNTNINYDFTGVPVSENGGFANLRMSIARRPGKSKKPKVKVNGTTVPVPNNWEGYDQASRTDFFGMISIPIPYELIKTTNNIQIEFKDGGGHVSSVILEVQNFESTPSGKLNGPEVITSVRAQYETEGFKVIPTVVGNGQFEIRYDPSKSYSVLTVHSLEGKQVHKQRLPANNQGTVQVHGLSGLGKGVYILRLNGPSASDTAKLIFE